MSSLDAIMNPYEDRKYTASSSIAEEKHSYSCKRCRRLKKKCTRTIPECLNCKKAHDRCEYVPRAPRRKKIEVLRTFNELRSKPEPNVQNIPKPANVTPILNQESQIVSAHVIQSHPELKQTPSLDGHRNSYNYNEQPPAHEQFISQPPLLQQQIRNMLDQRTLPPIRSLSIPEHNVQTLHFPQNRAPVQAPITLPQQSQPPSSTFQQYQLVPPPQPLLQQQILPQQQPSQPSQPPQPQQPQIPPRQQQQLQQQQKQLPPKSKEAFPEIKPNMVPSYNSISSKADSKRTIGASIGPSEIQQHLQDGILNNIIGLQESGNVKQITPPIEIDATLHYKCVEAFFGSYGIYLPFMSMEKHMERFQAVELSYIDRLHPKYSFDLFMVFYLGYCTLESHKKLVPDQKMKDYLVEKSVNNAAKAITYTDLNSVKYLLLLGIYTIFDNTGSSSWHISGLLVRLALNLSLNRKRVSNRGKTEEEVEMEHRLFWSVYNFDRWISIALTRSNMVNEDDINIPLPQPLLGEDPNEMLRFRVLLSLRRLESEMIGKLHSANAAEKYPTIEAKSEVITSLRSKIEKWYESADAVLSVNKGTLSHYVVNWYMMSYHHLIVSLYEPSFLIPNPSTEALAIVAESAIECLHNCSIIHQLNLLPLNWIQLYKYIHTFIPLLYCLYHGTADIARSQRELALVTEVFEQYSEGWPLVAEVKTIFAKLNHTLLTVSDREVLTSTIYDLTSQFHECIQGSDMGLSFGHPVFSQFAPE